MRFSDENGNGSISFTEFNKVHQAVAERRKQQTLTFEEILQEMSFVDDNSNGEIEYNEYEILIEPYLNIVFTIGITLNKYQQGPPSESLWKEYEDKRNGILEKLF